MVPVGRGLVRGCDLARKALAVDEQPKPGDVAVAGNQAPHQSTDGLGNRFAPRVYRTKTVQSGPFKGRVYREKVQGQWERMPELEEPHVSRSVRREAQRQAAVAETKLRKAVGRIRHQSDLDQILADAPDDATRTRMLDAWRPFLKFTPRAIEAPDAQAARQ